MNFAIDAIREVVILFKNIYEIYGDIKGASNSFKIEAYEQGKQNNLLTVILIKHHRKKIDFTKMGIAWEMFPFNGRNMGN